MAYGKNLVTSSKRKSTHGALLLQGCGPGYRKAEVRAAWNERAEQRARTIEENGLSILRGGAEVALSKHCSAVGLANAARGILAQVDARVIEHLPQITVPTLIIAGDGDTPYLTGVNYMAGKIAHADKLIIANAGHGANVEQPEVFNAAMERFLAPL